MDSTIKKATKIIEVVTLELEKPDEVDTLKKILNSFAKMPLGADGDDDFSDTQHRQEFARILVERLDNPTLVQTPLPPIPKISTTTQQPVVDVSDLNVTSADFKKMVLERYAKAFPFPSVSTLDGWKQMVIKATKTQRKDVKEFPTTMEDGAFFDWIVKIGFINEKGEKT